MPSPITWDRQEVFQTALFWAAMILLGCSLAFAQAQEKVLYAFGTNPNDGLFGIGSLVSDRAGNLYGITDLGGDNNAGTVFELAPNSDGTWRESVIYSFCKGNCPTGSAPNGLAIDSLSNLYGTARDGGNVNESGGVVFELSPPLLRGGSWTYTALYAFCPLGGNCEDGSEPLSPPILDASGNLYGTTKIGGENNGGTVFELSPGPSGWTETVLYSFCSTGGSNCTDGSNPLSGVTFDKQGNLYGTTTAGGAENGGVLYKLSVHFGNWTEAVLGAFPQTYRNPIPGPVSIDPAGNLYTTYTTFAQNYRNGEVIRLSKDGKVNMFGFNGEDGLGPTTGVIIDNQRRVLYGTTVESVFGYGNVFQIDKSGQESVLYSFCPQHPQCNGGGALPGGLMEDKGGNLYGVTLYGGNPGNYGVVFEIVP